MSVVQVGFTWESGSAFAQISTVLFRFLLYRVPGMPAMTQTYVNPMTQTNVDPMTQTYP